MEITFTAKSIFVDLFSFSLICLRKCFRQFGDTPFPLKVSQKVHLTALAFVYQHRLLIIK